ncbi:MAG TPA: hypothetical protein VMX13_00925 [Sedimentisphaerales bacterium]|nr:hypothetical protein [Sedimentisphaerales bacterium]
MTSMNNQQEQLLFDYCSSLTSEKETAEAEQLIASNEQAARLYRKLKAALAPLNDFKPQSCPEELVEGTIFRLNNVARSSQLRLEQLLDAEQRLSPQTKRAFWWNFGKTAAAAVAVFIILGTWFAPLDFIRHKYQQLQCQSRLAGVFQGFSNYVSDNDGKMPAVPTEAGAPWWKVGYKGPENHSATRSMWLLVKGRYVQPHNFSCPGTQKQLVIKIDPAQFSAYNDFPGRDYISYSVRICCKKAQLSDSTKPRILMADLSPVFERLPDDFTKPLKLVLTDDLLSLNSANHSRRGQNILLCDGSIIFMKQRHTEVSGDDIFTLMEMRPGFEITGCEVPSCETDNFLAP